MTTSEQINEIATAGAKAQAELKPAVKDATNPAFRAKYADYAAIVEAAKVYAKHGIAVWQDVQLAEAGVAVITRLTHTSGQWMEFGPLTVPTAKRDAHGVGSATTYAKRYALSAALGISADEDDDGNEASKSPTSGPQGVVAKSAPADYQAFMAQMSAHADAGMPRLTKALNDAPKELRLHLTMQDTQLWEQLKAKAAKVKASA